MQAHITKISQLDGQGPEMKLVFAAFFIGAMSIIGIPPAGGSWSKFMLMVGAADAGMVMVLIVLGVSSLLNIYYLLDPVARAFFKPKAKEVKIDWHPLTVWPPVATAVLCIVLFFFADPILGLAQAMVAG